MGFDLRCANWARTEGVDPIGTAGPQAGFLCFEYRRPWPKDLGDVEMLAPLARAAGRQGVRLQGLVPRADGDGLRAFLYRHPDIGNGFGGYFCSEDVSLSGDVVGRALRLLEEDGPAPLPVGSARDVLICTHGRRDVCCGSRGSALLAELERAGGLGPGVRLWATTHTGGHRFAPTVLVLPEGTMWAYMEPHTLRSIVRRQGPVADVLPYYRGCAGLPSSAAQAFERAVLGEVGWQLFDSLRAVADLGGNRLRLDATAPDGTVRSWAAEVSAGRLLTVPACGRSDQGATKSEVQLVVKRVWGVQPGTGGSGL